jgi:hypothetical protein
MSGAVDLFGPMQADLRIVRALLQEEDKRPLTERLRNARSIVSRDAQRVEDLLDELADLPLSAFAAVPEHALYLLAILDTLATLQEQVAPSPGTSS